MIKPTPYSILYNYVVFTKLPPFQTSGEAKDVTRKWHTFYEDLDVRKKIISHRLSFNTNNAECKLLAKHYAVESRDLEFPGTSKHNSRYPDINGIPKWFSELYLY